MCFALLDVKESNAEEFVSKWCQLVKCEFCRSVFRTRLTEININGSRSFSVDDDPRVYIRIIVQFHAVKHVLPKIRHYNDLTAEHWRRKYNLATVGAEVFVQATFTKAFLANGVGKYVDATSVVFLPNQHTHNYFSVTCTCIKGNGKKCALLLWKYFAAFSYKTWSVENSHLWTDASRREWPIGLRSSRYGRTGRTAAVCTPWRGCSTWGPQTACLQRGLSLWAQGPVRW